MISVNFKIVKLFINMNYIEKKPWGTFENILEEEYCKVKKIVIKPGQRPSYQYHFKRSEHWVIVKGTAKITVDDKEKKLNQGDYVFIPLKAKHRIENTGESDLIFIEVQTGEYFGEEDIVRVSNDY